MKLGKEEAYQMQHLDGFLKDCNITVNSVSEGKAAISVELTDDVRRLGGIMNGGAILTFCDFAGALSIMSLQDVMNNFTVSMNADFLEMVDRGPVLFEACVEKEGKNLAFVGIRVMNPDGKLCARVHGIWKLIR